MTAWVGQYCIYVRDLDEAVTFYEALGLTCTSRTDLDDIREAIVENPDKGGKLQLAQRNDQDGPIEMGNAFWKLYVATNDIEKVSTRGHRTPAPRWCRRPCGSSGGPCRSAS